MTLYAHALSPVFPECDCIMSKLSFLYSTSIQMAGNAADIDTSSVAIHRMPRTRYLTNSSENEPVAVWGRHINKSYVKLRVLKDLDITVPRGCMYVTFIVQCTFHGYIKSVLCLTLYHLDTYFDACVVP